MSVRKQVQQEVERAAQKEQKKPGLVRREQETAAAKERFMQSGLGRANNIINNVIAPPLMQSDEQKKYRQAQRALERQRRVAKGKSAT